MNDYLRALKRNGFIGQAFDFDREGHNKELLNKKEITANMAKLQLTGKTNLVHNFTSVYGSLVHMKIMRVFADAVLRFGVPGDSKFFMGIVRPERKQDEKKLLQKLSDNFAEAHLQQMGVYGEKVDAQDEDFFPYVSAPLKNPECLMDK